MIEAKNFKPATIQTVDSKPDRQSQAGYDPDSQVYHLDGQTRGRENPKPIWRFDRFGLAFHAFNSIEIQARVS
jgi:hypothetical protein